MTADKLLPCPFCNEQPEIVHKAHPSGLPGIRCMNCNFIVKQDREDKTIGFWNRREFTASIIEKLHSEIEKLGVIKVDYIRKRIEGNTFKGDRVIEETISLYDVKKALSRIKQELGVE